MTPSTALVEQVQRHLLDHPDADPDDVLARLAPLLPGDRRREVLRLVRARRRGLGAIDDLLADESVSEVMINGPGAVWVERAGRVEVSEVRLERAEIDLLVERLVVPIGRRVDQRSPTVGGTTMWTRLPSDSRPSTVGDR